MTGRFGSVVTAMVTPFRPDHGVDLDGAQELASWLTDNGSDSVFVVGSTGESPTLSHKEKSDLFRAVGDADTVSRQGGDEFVLLFRGWSTRNRSSAPRNT